MKVSEKAQTKLTEDETIKLLMSYLKGKNWTIENYALGQQRGYDIIASNSTQRIYIEVKGAKANDLSPTKKRKYFDKGQIKDHFGKAIIKSLETMNDFPNAIVGIAHPDDEDIRNCIGEIIHHINKLGIKHFWVGKNGIQVEESWSKTAANNG